MTTEPFPVSVLVPTIGRRELLEQCLRSVLACDPPPDEVVVVDQSGGREVEALLEELDSRVVRRVACDGRGIARAMNLGLREASYDTVLVTHDDCIVASDWVKTAITHARAHPDGIVTGRVMPAGDSPYVPSVRTDPEPHDHTGTLASGVLFPANMVANRRRILEIGGFDERPSLMVAAEDNDLCYRWLSEGRTFRYEPDLVVWHQDWRSPEQLVQTYKAYGRAQGGYYAKHIHAGDLRILRLLRWDIRQGLRSTARGVLRREPRWQDPYREMVFPLLAGLIAGWRESRRLDRTARGRPSPADDE